MTRALLDDYLLRDLLADDVGDELGRLLRDHEPATTNLYLLCLSRSVVGAAGDALTGLWGPSERRALGGQLLALPRRIERAPMRVLTCRMAEIASTQRVSTLGAEAVAAAEHLDAPLCVWEGDDGPGIRTAMAAIDASYRTVAR